MNTETYNCLSIALGVLAFGGLVWYVSETRRIAKAAIEQAEAVQKPFITIEQILDVRPELEETYEGEPNPATGQLIEPVRVYLRNIGSGPALNTRFRFFNAGLHGDPLDGAPVAPPLQPGEALDSGQLARKLDPQEEHFIAEYESLSGQRYRTRATIRERRRRQDFRFERLA